jgi:hypothetical protein
MFKRRLSSLSSISTLISVNLVRFTEQASSPTSLRFFIFVIHVALTLPATLEWITTLSTWA